MESTATLSDFLKEEDLLRTKFGDAPHVYQTGKTSYLRLILENNKIYVASLGDKDKDYFATLTLEKAPQRILTATDKIKVTKVNFNSAKGIIV